MAFAVHKQDTMLRDQLNEALIRVGPAITRVLADYNVPTLLEGGAMKLFAITSVLLCAVAVAAASANSVSSIPVRQARRSPTAWL